MDVIHGPRRAEPGTYDGWTRVLRTVDPRLNSPIRAPALTADGPRLSTAIVTSPAGCGGR
jgi:hypothetical protein